MSSVDYYDVNFTPPLPRPPVGTKIAVPLDIMNAKCEIVIANTVDAAGCMYVGLYITPAIAAYNIRNVIGRRWYDILIGEIQVRQPSYAYTYDGQVQSYDQQTTASYTRVYPWSDLGHYECQPYGGGERGVCFCFMCYDEYLNRYIGSAFTPTAVHSANSDPMSILNGSCRIVDDWWEGVPLQHLARKLRTIIWLADFVPQNVLDAMSVLNVGIYKSNDAIKTRQLTCASANQVGENQGCVSTLTKRQQDQIQIMHIIDQHLGIADLTDIIMDYLVYSNSSYLASKGMILPSTT